MNLADYWQQLENSLKQFEGNHRSLAFDNSTDKAEYEIQLALLKTMLKFGQDIEKITFRVDIKKNLGKQLDDLPKQHFGDQQIPKIAGKASALLAEKVYLPHIQRFQEVKFSSVIITLASAIGVDIVARQEAAKAQAKMLEEAIKNYEHSLQKSSPPVSATHEKITVKIKKGLGLFFEPDFKRFNIICFARYLLSEESDNKSLSDLLLFDVIDEAKDIAQVIMESPFTEPTKTALLKNISTPNSKSVILKLLEENEKIDLEEIRASLQVIPKH